MVTGDWNRFFLQGRTRDYNTFERGVRGGSACANIGRVQCNTEQSTLYDESKPVVSAGMVDFNALYSEVMSQKLPIDGFYELTESEIQSFDMMSVDINGKYAYALEVDYTIPDNTQLCVDMYASVLIRTI